MLKIFLAAVTFLLLSGPISAHANLVWNWTGECAGLVPVLYFFEGCAGQATLSVTVTDAYVPGTILDATVDVASRGILVDARYTDANVTFDFMDRWNEFGGGSLLLPAQSGDGLGFLQDSLPTVGFRSSPGGVWLFSADGVYPPSCGTPGPGSLCPSGYTALGSGGVWTVPEPTTLVLLGVGLVGFGFSCGRKRLLRQS
jgi:hypothetical protein